MVNIILKLWREPPPFWPLPMHRLPKSYVLMKAIQFHRNSSTKCLLISKLIL
ncbi:hypothetical protein FOIG_16825 [Fusarium odoratissimum NRRL 54006]|uniref:Uncharacterized protein n=1 Tax=Fusarium odoratissimum (strain NRRL 54006) TaxID=1089451 RepID=X0JYG0_FUSO5|nr:uncharacterized protein FOIG_16825 [Fusarium odoratissimum NRRL 54006]EXL89894.1 hypothetical protein FOIG_16825 [Fusarium odoratissimum NRRL 54006]